MSPSSCAPPIILDVGLFFTVALIGETFFTADMTAVRLAVALHMLVSIYAGRFSGWHKVTWLALVFVGFALTAAGFLSYLLPLAQTSFWLTAKFGDLGISPTSAWMAAGALAWLVIFADIIALHAGRLRQRRAWRVMALIVPAFLLGAVSRDIAHLVMAPQQTAGALPTPQHILPSLDMLPAYAILRAVPGKPLGISVLAAVLLLPAVAAWTRNWRFHAPQTRAIWLGSSAALGASWIGLAVLGAQPPQDGPQWGVFALVVYQALFFLVVPFVLARSARPEDQRALVFE